jgi:DNA-binding transcriptional MerR regulator
MNNDRPHQIPLPDKLYFRIGEVSTITELPAYVLRFWETEFKRINPKRTPSGQRLYRKQDVELILTIKFLLYEKKFTIPGAKQYLSSTTDWKKKNPSRQVLDEIRLELEKIRDMLS